MATRSGKRVRSGRGPVGFGIIGCGVISTFHGQALRASPRTALVAVYDVVEAAARKVGGQFGVAWYTDLKKFLAHPGLEGVTVGTPSGAHLEPTLAALAAGKHVICEKPLEITLEKCDRMIAAAKKSGSVLSVVFPSRFQPGVQELKKALDAGRLGRLSSCAAIVKWYRTQAYYDSGAWRGTWALDGGGALMNQSVHTVDLLLYLAGEVKELVAFAGCLAHERIEVEDEAVAALRFRSGALGFLEGSACAAPGMSRYLQLAGDRGTVYLTDELVTDWRFLKEHEQPGDATMVARFGPKEVKAGPGAADPKAISYVPHMWQFSDVAKVIRQGGEPLVTAPSARRATELILAIYDSALHGGRPVVLPLKATPKLGRMPGRDGKIPRGRGKPVSN
jgi:predicted dehydrogenase